MAHLREAVKTQTDRQTDRHGSPKRGSEDTDRRQTDRQIDMAHLREAVKTQTDRQTDRQTWLT